jgi:flavin-binding protein dodecin
VVEELIRVNGHEQGCYIRPTIILGYGEIGLNPLPSTPQTIVATWEWGSYLGEEALINGVRVMLSSYRRIGKNTIPPAGKANGQYLNSSLAKVDALRAGYDEAIMLSEDGYVAEGTGENLFVVTDGVVCTPPLSRRPAGWDHPCERDAHRPRPGLRGGGDGTCSAPTCYLADEIFLTGTAAELTPVREVSGRDRYPGSDHRSGQTTFIDAVRGRSTLPRLAARRRGLIPSRPRRRRRGLATVPVTHRQEPDVANVYKKIELVGSSRDGVDDAIRRAITKASETMRNLDWFEVKEIRGWIQDGEPSTPRSPSRSGSASRTSERRGSTGVRPRRYAGRVPLRGGAVPFSSGGCDAPDAPDAVPARDTEATSASTRCPAGPGTPRAPRARRHHYSPAPVAGACRAAGAARCPPSAALPPPGLNHQAMRAVHGAKRRQR